MNFRRFIRDWSLPLSMMTGASAYFLGRSLELPTAVREAVLEGIGYVQPTLIFLMLTLTFCRIRLKDMRLRGWQWWLLAFQASVAALLCLFHQTTEDLPTRVCLQSTMLCFLCPTATAAAVVTAKLGGNVGSLTAYTLLINLTSAVLISAFVPLVNPTGGLSFWLSFWMIIRKVFPLLIFPLFLALIIRRISPTLLRRLTSIPDLPFYLWLVSLSLAIAVTTRILVHTEASLPVCLLILVGSLVACIAQFATGRLVGRHYDESVTAGQACGQKNTVLAIWVGYTFLDPLTSVAGGFYTIWHNLFNAWQLYRLNTRNHTS
ncbi:MAG: transporter [Bacteroidaceae bacterium]|nr:transporter [Bacteroidaceae bacterium]